MTASGDALVDQLERLAARTKASPVAAVQTAAAMVRVTLRRIEHEARSPYVEWLKANHPSHAHTCERARFTSEGPWYSVPCTCVPRALSMIHQQGCAHAAAFSANIKQWEAEQNARQCTCGLDDLIGETC